ncbi:MAG: adenylate/guanylate cyclase with Chase sensor [Burkholderia sp.]|nr:adenylate/guanylate cyclase with Chase sensor [Burkholderia sp.]
MPLSWSALCRAAIFPVFLLAACGALLLDPLPLQTLRNNMFDQYQRWQPRVYQDVGVRIVDIDDDSLRRLGQWPWPRSQVAELVERLRAAGAAAVAFDVLFAEPDRTAPRALLKHWKLAPDAAAQVAALDDPDSRLTAALRGGGTVLGVAATNDSDGQPSSPPPSPHFGLVTRGPDASARLPGFNAAIGALEPLATAAAGNGAMTFIPDADGIVRRVPLLLRAGDAMLPSLTAEALRVAESARTVVMHTGDDGIAAFGIGRHTVPVTASGEFWVHFSHAAARRTVPAWQVLDGTAPAGAFDKSIVLVGTSAQGLQDLRFSPLGGIIPGVEVHAQALEQVLSGDWLQRPAWAGAAEALTLVAGSLLLYLLALHAGALPAALAAALLLAALNWGAWQAYASGRLLLDGVTPSIGMAGAFVLASVLRHRASERRQRWVRQAFARYVSPNLVAHLVDHPQQLELGGRRQDCSFIFTDLEGYTGLMESREPEQAVSLLNDYLEQMIAIAFAHDGTLDRIVGDAVAIMFSAPVPQPDHPSRALACALAMQRFASAYAAAQQAQGIPFGRTRIGVHCGEVVVGNFGGAAIFDYRALGDPVNTAARLETLNRHLGTRMCVSGAIRAACPDAAMRPVGQVLLKGKRQPLMVYEPLDAVSADAGYEAAYRLLAAGDAGAVAAFMRLHVERPDDGLIAFHLRRLQAGEGSELMVMADK